jgi:hypothetical protein
MGMADVSSGGGQLPGMAFRFFPKKGSGYSPAATRAASTVEGTDAGYQPDAENPAVDRTPPPLLTFDDD